MGQFPLVDISLQHDQLNAQLRVHLRANDQDFGQVISNIVFTVRWPEASPATLGLGASAWCPPPNQALNIGPSATAVPGNGFRYRTYSSIGLAQIAALQDDAGCGQSLMANEWAHVLTIPVNADPGGTVFDIADDDFSLQDNRNFYVSLNGVPSTGAIFTYTANAVEQDDTMLEQRVIAPNPAAAGSMITILGAGRDGSWSAQLLDASGRVIRSWQGAQWPVRLSTMDQAPGIYAVRLEHAGLMSICKLVIE